MNESIHYSWMRDMNATQLVETGGGGHSSQAAEAMERPQAALAATSSSSTGAGMPSAPGDTPPGLSTIARLPAHPPGTLQMHNGACSAVSNDSVLYSMRGRESPLWPHGFSKALENCDS